MTQPQSSREQRRLQEIADLEALVAEPTPAQERAAVRFLALMQRGPARGRLWWFCYRVADWVLRRFKR